MIPPSNGARQQAALELHNNPSIANADAAVDADADTNTGKYGHGFGDWGLGQGLGWIPTTRW